jgi:hypothetical protein
LADRLDAERAGVRSGAESDESCRCDRERVMRRGRTTARIDEARVR